MSDVNDLSIPTTAGHLSYGQHPQPRSFGQPPSGSHATPPRRNPHRLRNGLLGALIAIVLLLVGGSVLARKAEKAVDATDMPVAVAEGEAFKVDWVKAAVGWRVVEDSASASIEGLRVSNSSREAETPSLIFSFYRNNVHLGKVECRAAELQATDVSTMNCSSLALSALDGYQSIRVAEAA